MKKWRKTSLTEKYLLRQAPQQLSSPTIYNKVINSIDLKTWETVPIRENLPCFLSTKVPALQQQFSTKLPATNTITLACNFSLLIRNPQFPLLLPLRKIQRKVKKKKHQGGCYYYGCVARQPAAVNMQDTYIKSREMWHSRPRQLSDWHE